MYNVEVLYFAFSVNELLWICKEVKVHNGCWLQRSSLTLVANK